MLLFIVDNDHVSAQFSKDQFGCHPAIKQLSQHVDMMHLCGFLTLLNPCRPSGIEQDGDVGSLQLHLSTSASVSVSETASVEDISGNPSNGLTDELSAEMLASELDALDNTTALPNRENMSLELKAPVGSVMQENNRCNGPGRAHLEAFNEADWQLLDMCFGIPLFDPQLNKEVCHKIVSLGLFTDDRYVSRPSAAA